MDPLDSFFDPQQAPAQPSDPLADFFDKSKAPTAIPQRLETARQEVAKDYPEEGAGQWTLRNFVAPLRGPITAGFYGAARKRLDEGKPEPQDFRSVALYEQEKGRDTATDEGWGGYLGSRALQLPGQIAGIVGGGLAAKAVTPLVGLGGAGAGAAAGRLGLQAALTPSLYAERAIHANLDAKREPYDVRGLPASVGLAVAQLAVLNAVGAGSEKFLPGMALPGRVATQGVIGGAVAQPVTDVVTSLLGLDSGYGTYGALYRGEYGKAAKEAVSTALTFAAFTALHGNPARAKEVLGEVRDQAQEEARNGAPNADAIRAGVRKVMERTTVAPQGEAPSSVSPQAALDPAELAAKIRDAARGEGTQPVGTVLDFLNDAGPVGRELIRTVGGTQVFITDSPRNAGRPSLERAVGRFVVEGGKSFIELDRQAASRLSAWQLAGVVAHEAAHAARDAKGRPWGDGEHHLDSPDERSAQRAAVAALMQLPKDWGKAPASQSPEQPPEPPAPPARVEEMRSALAFLLQKNTAKWDPVKVMAEARRLGIDQARPQAEVIAEQQPEPPAQPAQPEPPPTSPPVAPESPEPRPAPEAAPASPEAAPAPPAEAPQPAPPKGWESVGGGVTAKPADAVASETGLPAGMHAHPAQKEVKAKAAGWILGDDHHWQTYPEAKAGVSDADLAAVAAREPLPLPKGGEAAGAQFKGAWDAVSRLWPEAAAGVKRVRVVDFGRADVRAAISGDGTLIVPEGREVRPDTLWHELVHLQQHAEGRAPGHKERTDEQHLEIEREAYARAAQMTHAKVWERLDAQQPRPAEAPLAARLDEVYRRAHVAPDAEVQSLVAEVGRLGAAEARSVAREFGLRLPPSASKAKVVAEVARKFEDLKRSYRMTRGIDPARDAADDAEMARQAAPKLTAADLVARLRDGKPVEGLTEAQARDLYQHVVEEKSFEAIGRQRGVSKQAVQESAEKAAERLHGVVEEPPPPTIADVRAAAVAAAGELPLRWTEQPKAEKLSEALLEHVAYLQSQGRRLTDEQSDRVFGIVSRLGEASKPRQRKATAEALAYLREAGLLPAAAEQPAPVPGGPRGLRRQPAGAAAREGTAGAAEGDAPAAPAPAGDSAPGGLSEPARLQQEHLARPLPAAVLDHLRELKAQGKVYYAQKVLELAREVWDTDQVSAAHKEAGIPKTPVKAPPLSKGGPGLGLNAQSNAVGMRGDILPWLESEYQKQLPEFAHVQAAAAEAARAHSVPEAQEALRRGLQDGADAARAQEAPAGAAPEPDGAGESPADHPGDRLGADPGTFDPAEFGAPLSDAERRTLPGGGQPGAGERGPRTTALANAVMEAERRTARLSEIAKAARLENETVWDEAQARAQADPQLPFRLTDELAAKPRSTTVQENALLLQHKIAVRNEYSRVAAEYLSAMLPGAAKDAVDFDALERREAQLAKEVDKVDAVTRATGTEWGRAGQFRRQLAAEDYSLAGMLQQAAAAKGEPLTPQEKAEVLQLQQTIERLQAKLDAAEADYEKRTGGEARNEPSVLTRPSFRAMNAARADVERALAQFKRKVGDWRQDRQTLGVKVGDWLIKLRQNMVISSPTTLLKIAAASASRFGSTPLEEAAGSALARIPGLSKLAAMAPREGRGFSRDTERRSFASGIAEGFRDAWATAKTGQSDLDVVYGKDKGAPRGWLDLQFGLHAALKAPAVRAEYTRSFLTRVDEAALRGEDVTSPAALLRLQGQAYRDAQGAKFQQDNWLVDKINRALTPSPEAGGVERAATTFGKLMLPVVRIPTNLAFEVAQYAFGSVRGLTNVARAFAGGLENLKPQEADAIMQQLKKGSLGVTMLAAGYLNPTTFGGYYSGKRDDRDVGVGAMKVGGVEVPSWLMHNPMLEVLQLGATIRRASDKVYKGQKQGTAEGLYDGLRGWADEFPLVREAADVGKLLSPSPRERGHYLGETAKSFAVPQLVQWLAGQTDKSVPFSPTEAPQKRKPEGVKQHIWMGIPGVRQEVPARH